ASSCGIKGEGFDQSRSREILSVSRLCNINSQFRGGRAIAERANTKRARACAELGSNRNRRSETAHTEAGINRTGAAETRGAKASSERASGSHSTRAKHNQESYEQHSNTRQRGCGFEV